MVISAVDSDDSVTFCVDESVDSKKDYYTTVPGSLFQNLVGLPIIERRAIIDIGSGGTKYTIADVNLKTHSIQIVKEGKLFVSYQKALEGSQDNSFSEEIQQGAIQSIQEIKKVCFDLHTDRIYAVATEAFRNASNSDHLVSKIRENTGVEIEVISQEIEGRIGYENARFQSPLSEKELVVLEVGTGSFQMTAKKNEEFLHHLGGFGAVPFHAWLRDEVNENVLNMGEEGVKAADRLARSICWKADRELKSMIHKDANRVIVGVGNFFSRSLGGFAADPSRIVRSDLRQFISNTLENQNDVQDPFLETDLTNSILALGFMKAFQIHEIKLLDSSNTQTMLTSELFWKI